MPKSALYHSLYHATGLMSARGHLFRPPRGVTLRDIRFEMMALGVMVVRGTLWPSGEHFAAALWATSGRPGGDRILQVIYTDRGAYRTGLDVYELAQEIEEYRA